MKICYRKTILCLIGINLDYLLLEGTGIACMRVTFEGRIRLACHTASWATSSMLMKAYNAKCLPNVFSWMVAEVLTMRTFDFACYCAPRYKFLKNMIICPASSAMTMTIIICVHVQVGRIASSQSEWPFRPDSPAQPAFQPHSSALCRSGESEMSHNPERFHNLVLSYLQDYAWISMEFSTADQ